jgi:hypothetical protein
MTCEHCGGTGWIVKEGLISAVAPCACRRAVARKPFEDDGTPLDEVSASVYVDRLCAVLSFAPAEDGRPTIVHCLMLMCETVAEAAWTTHRACELYTRWDDCGVPGLRQIVSSFRKPSDGISISSTPAFPEGLPPLRTLPAAEPLRLPPGSSPRALESGEPVAAAACGFDRLPELSPEEKKRQREFDQVLEEVLTPTDQRPKARPPRRRRLSEVIRLNDDPEHEPRPAGTYKRMTQADIDEAVAKLHGKTG